MSERTVFEDCTFTTFMAPGWRPIKSAPRDGTAVLLYYPEGVAEPDWNGVEGRHVPCFAVMSFRGTGWVSGTSPGGEPTHWIALPSPPEN